VRSFIGQLALPRGAPRVRVGAREIAAGIAALLAVVAFAAAYTFAAYRTEPYLPLVAGGVMLTALLAFTRPLIALLIALALVPLEVFSVSVANAGVTPAEAMFVFTGVAWAVRRIVGGELPLAPSPLGKPFALLLLALLPGIAVAPDTFPIFKTLILWSAFYLVYQMIVVEARPETVREILFALAIAGGIVGLVAMAGTGGGAQQELVGAGDIAEGRAVGSFDHPNTLATFLALGLPGALVLGLAGRVAARPLLLGAFALTFAGLALSLSRGGLLAVAGALGVMLIWPPFRRFVLVLVLVATGFAVVNANPFGDIQQVNTVQERISSVGYSARQVDPRFAVWDKSPEIIAEHPFFGVGAVNFSEIAPSYGLTGLGQNETYEHAHNIPLTVFAELGIIGISALVWIAVALAKVVVTAYRRTSGVDRGLACALGAALVAVTVQGMVDYTLRSNVVVALLFVLAGCAVVLSRADRPAAETLGSGRVGSAPNRRPTRP
jgi:O-antigen ligase